MTYVMSDIHGNMRRFQSVMEQINLQPEDTLYILGDVIDRYPHGIKILRELMAMPNVRMLLGNHEYMMLRALGYPYEEDAPMEDSQEDRLRLWYSNGGRVTHEYLKHLRKSVREEIFAYLRALPLNIDIEINGHKYKLVHASPLEGYVRHTHSYDSPAAYAVWKRIRSYDINPVPETLIFGHTATKHYQVENPMKIWCGDNMIGIDCGSGYPEPQTFCYPRGRLACLRREDMKEFYSDETPE